ncbi:primosomal protein N' [Chungangia koreensis]|uniref:Replication restart protein PriA n=1 Tax=Chungangia koreensis TaxID=752657 RepID=A0ABV8X154_9LACT
MIAEVIVDIAAYPIDKPFDYVVPKEMEDIVEPGVRVKVPFGNRKLLGFITEIKDESDLNIVKLKQIEEILDITPVLTKEMLEMADWMKNHVLCFEIDALFAMLPSALKAKYERVIRLKDRSRLVDSEAQALFEKREAIPLHDVTSMKLLSILKKYSEEGIIEVETIVKQKTSVKKERILTIQSETEISKLLSLLSPQAKKQKELMDWMIGHAGEILSAKYVLESTGVQPAVLNAVIEKGAAITSMEEVYRDPNIVDLGDHSVPFQVTEEQAKVMDALMKEKDQPATFLLHGVTGSGKTEIYLQMIQDVISRGKEAIVLVPEISLTPQMNSRFKSRFGDLVAVMHSGLSAGEKYDEWRKIQRGEVKVVVGARSAIFAPFTNLGVIILDEEHESTYKQDDTPRYHARDIAIWRSQYYSCPVILGSATPSLESYARASKGVYRLLTMKERANHHPLPAVHVVDMRDELKNGNRSMFSVDLADAVRKRLERKEQIVLFLNKRGYSSFVLCRDCGTTVQCPNCDISLTYHRASEVLRCHYCGHEEHVPTNCPECSSEHIRFFGTGTQKVEEEVSKLFPGARVLRMDVDTTRQKGAHEAILKDFGDGKADILLGTQMIAKGLDFPNITLVGVLTADTTLNLSDFRAAEKTFQLLTQVSGRAGRHDKPGEVFIQTYSPEHYAIQHAKNHSYEPFYRQEMMARKQYEYPPFYYLTLIQFSHEDLMKVSEYAGKTVEWLRQRLSDQSAVIGPTAAAISRVNNRYRYQCLIKYKKEIGLTETLQQLIKMYRTEWLKTGLYMTIDMDPSTIM